jgi:hypothetical protein
MAWLLWSVGPGVFANCSNAARRAADQGFDTLCTLDQMHDPSNMLSVLRLSGAVYIFGAPLLLLLFGWGALWLAGLIIPKISN